MPKYKKKITIRDLIVYTQITNNILEEVFKEHPDIVTRAIIKFVEENKKK